MGQQEKAYKHIFTPANVVTTVRIALIPVFVVIILAPWPSWVPDVKMSQMLEDSKPIIAAVVFTLLALTDSVDGYLARSRNEVTTLGKFLDPLADKILISAALLALIELGLLPAWVAIVIIAREFLVSGLRMVVSMEGLAIAAAPLGKVKTVAQIVAVVLFIIKGSRFVRELAIPWPYVIDAFSWVIMVVALALTLLSLADYFFKSSTVLGIPLKRPLTETGARLLAAEAGVEAAAEPGDVTSPLPDTTQLKPCEVIDLARTRGFTIGTAESCTGGLVAATLTDVSGASEVFKGTVVSYTNEVKEKVLGVPHEILETVGPVSAETAEAMAQGALSTLGVDIAVSVTGFAGPEGGTAENPVGTVWFACAWDADEVRQVRSETHRFSGGRDAVRSKACNQALRIFIEELRIQ